LKHRHNHLEAAESVATGSTVEVAVGVVTVCVLSMLVTSGSSNILLLSVDDSFSVQLVSIKPPMNTITANFLIEFYFGQK
jgi:hypothetical protein